MSPSATADPKPATIMRHAFGVYPSIAMLAGMQLDIFTPLKEGPLTEAALAQALGVELPKLRPLLYALVAAGLLTRSGERFANTPEADTYLVRGRSKYFGGAHELYADLWSAALKVGPSIRLGAPQAKHDFATMSDDELGAFLRGLHGGALAAGRQLAPMFGFDKCSHLGDVGGGSGGLAIAACELCPELSATVVELPRVAPITRSFIEAAGLSKRIKVLPTNIVEHAPDAQFDIAVARNLIQVLGAHAAARAIKNLGEAIWPGETLLIVGHVLRDDRLSPLEAVGMNLAFLGIYDEGQAYTEEEHRSWLTAATFSEVSVRFGAASGGASIVVARKWAGYP